MIKMECFFIENQRKNKREYCGIEEKGENFQQVYYMDLVWIPIEYRYLCVFIYVHEWGRKKEERDRDKERQVDEI